MGEAQPEKFYQRAPYGEQKRSSLTPALTRKSMITLWADRLIQGGNSTQVGSYLLRLYPTPLRPPWADFLQLAILGLSMLGHHY